MLSEPKIVERAEQPYAAIRAHIARRDITKTADETLPEVLAWLGARGVVPTSPPFFKYNAIDYNAVDPTRELDLSVGVPTPGELSGDSRVLAGTLPAGRYAMLVHQGPYDRLMQATATLLKWVDDNGFKLDATETPDGTQFGCRLEVYVTDPRREPDPEKWETEVRVRLADA